MSRRFAVLLSLNVMIFLVLTCIHFTKAQGAYSSIPQSSQEPSDKQEPKTDDSAIVIDKNLIPDFGEVSPTLYRGAQPKKQGFEALAKMGVQIVVDLRGDRDGERKEVTRLGMQYIPMYWQRSFPKDRLFADFLTLIRENPDKKIFVHCRVGDDRTGMMVAAYRMVEQGWSAEKAKQEMISFGFSLVHRHLICLRLADYEEEFPKRFAKNPEFEKLRTAKQERPAQSPVN